MNNGTDEKQLSADEIALYDRQIRLWGMGTQLRLRSTKVLVINLGAVGTEVVKNLVLGGINSLEILDSSVLKPEDFLAQFFLPNDDSKIGSLKLPLVVDQIRDLNGRVSLSVNTDKLTSLLENEVEAEAYLSQFDLVIATELEKSQILSLNGWTRQLKIPLYVSGMHGMFGYIFTDLIEHTSVVKKDLGNQSRQANTLLSKRKRIVKVELDEKEKKEDVTIHDEYVPLPAIFTSKELPSQLNKRQMKRLSAAFPLLFALFELAKKERPEDDVDENLLKETLVKICASFGIPATIVNDEYVQLFSKQAFTEFAPVSAILGGCLAQDVIQYLSKQESPINNCLILDAFKSEMPIYIL